MRKINQYATLVFDCDGVILNSNQIKIDAYRLTALELGATQAQAQALVDYHVRLGGISRYVKFEYFLETILNKVADEASIEKCLAIFGGILDYTLLQSEVAPELIELKSLTSKASWMVVSGGDQDEVLRILTRKGIHSLFELGVYGSPDNKDTILAREIGLQHILFPAIFFGDSRYDHIASTKHGLDFVFLSRWTDMQGWSDYCAQQHITIYPSFSEIIHANDE